MYNDAVWLHISNWPESVMLVVFGVAAIALAMALRARATSLRTPPPEAAAPAQGAIAPALRQD